MKGMNLDRIGDDLAQAYEDGFEDGYQKGLEENKILADVENRKFKLLQKQVLDWADEKNLLHKENKNKQFMKFIEEVFEFKTELDAYIYIENDLNAKYDVMGEIYSDKHFYTTFDNLKLEMGNIFVTLIILCRQLDIDPVECLELAYKIDTDYPAWKEIETQEQNRLLEILEEFVVRKGKQD